MSAKFVQDGNSIDYRPEELVSSGDVVMIGTLVGVAKLDIPAGSVGSLATVGVYDIAKGSGVEFELGSAVGWDADAKEAIADTSVKLGIAVASADADASTVRVLINR